MKSKYKKRWEFSDVLYQLWYEIGQAVEKKTKLDSRLPTSRKKCRAVQASTRKVSPQGFLFLSDEGPMLETLDHTIRIGSTPTFLYFDLYLYSAYAAHYVYFYDFMFFHMFFWWTDMIFEATNSFHQFIHLPLILFALISIYIRNGTTMQPQFVYDI